MGEVMPVRKSTNEVEGINRCECGQIRTIHRARGKRAKFLYAICDDCGTNQQTGVFWQSRFKLHFPTVEALLASESQSKQEGEKAPNSAVYEQITEPKAKPEPTEPQSVSNTEQPEQKQNAEPQKKPVSDPVTGKAVSGWRVVLTGIILGGLTGGLITRL